MTISMFSRHFTFYTLFYIVYFVTYVSSNDNEIIKLPDMTNRYSITNIELLSNNTKDDKIILNRLKNVNTTYKKAYMCNPEYPYDFDIVIVFSIMLLCGIFYNEYELLVMNYIITSFMICVLFTYISCLNPFKLVIAHCYSHIRAYSIYRMGVICS